MFKLASSAGSVLVVVGLVSAPSSTISAQGPLKCGAANDTSAPLLDLLEIH